jgi:hypothetical protein
MQSTGQASTHAVSFVPMQGSAMTYAMGHLRCLSPYAFHKEDSSVAEVDSWRMEPTIEKISVEHPGGFCGRVTVCPLTAVFGRYKLNESHIFGGPEISVQLRYK